MNEKKLRNLSIITCIMGISLLFYLSLILEPPLIKISDISDSLVDSKVKIQGDIYSIKRSNSVNSLFINDSSGKILVVYFDLLPAFVEKPNKVEVIGSVKLYNDDLEIIADEFKSLS